MSKYRGPTEVRIERSLLPWVPVVFLAYDKELCGRHFLFCSKVWQELWSTGARSPSTHYILRYTHNTGASIIADRKKENLPPLGYCLCLQSTPFSAFSSLFGIQPEIQLRSHVNRKWSFFMFACGGGGGGATSHTFSYMKSKRCSLNLQSNQQGSCQRTDRLHKEPTLLFVNCKWKLNNI